MATSDIRLAPVEPGDYTALARLEALAFGDDEFSRVAFGPQRLDDEILEVRGKEMLASIKRNSDGEVTKHVKAVRGDETVGFAGWVTVWPESGGVGIYKKMEVEKKDENEDGEKKVGTVGNEKLSNDLFVPGDGYMAVSCHGGAYHSMYSCLLQKYKLTISELFILVVSPECQRQGIGTILLEDGLKEADELGLQCVLGASPEGLGLYKKHGFSEFKNMSLNLWEYEGGEGMGVVDHCIMHRPAKT